MSVKNYGNIKTLHNNKKILKNHRWQKQLHLEMHFSNQKEIVLIFENNHYICLVMNIHKFILIVSIHVIKSKSY